MATSSTRPRILVVEDELIVAMDIEATLEGLGYDVIGPMPRLAMALNVAAGDLPDAALLDINLHGETTYPLADALAARAIPFVFMSGYNLADLPARLKAVRIIAKPIDMHRLGDIVDSLLHENGGHAAAS